MAGSLEDIAKRLSPDLGRLYITPKAFAIGQHRSLTEFLVFRDEAQARDRDIIARYA